MSQMHTCEACGEQFPDFVLHDCKRWSCMECGKKRCSREEGVCKSCQAEKAEELYADATNPPHYSELTPQPIEVIESWGLTFHRGSVVKYVARAGRKSRETELEDLKKARWFLDRDIARLEGKVR